MNAALSRWYMHIQMSMLLNLERPQDAIEYWEPGSPLQAQLTADEVRREVKR